MIYKQIHEMRISENPNRPIYLKSSLVKIELE